jgi:hypothetical protein
VTLSTDGGSTDGTRTDDPTGTRTGVADVVVPFPGRRSHGTVPPAGGAFTIDCADCAHRCTAVCDDCVVSFIVGRAPEDALVVDADEARAVRLLERAGLVPGVRHEARAGGA